MRVLPAFLTIIFLLAPCVSPAQPSTTPGYTKFDQQQFAKLRASVGTWKCIDVPASKKPDVQTTKQAGNYFVTRESGDDPSTSYTRWSTSYRMYYTVSIDDSGGTQVYMTKGLEPFNSTWTEAYPARAPDGKPFFPAFVTMRGNTITSSGQYYDDKGRVRNGRSTCTKIG